VPNEMDAGAGQHIGFRVDEAVAAAIDGLLPKVTQALGLPASRVAVVREAIVRGLVLMHEDPMPRVGEMAARAGPRQFSVRLDPDQAANRECLVRGLRALESARAP
jgi:hypothetical protein